MAEQTTEPQATEPNENKPEWLVKTEKLEEAVKQGLGVQVVFKSNDETDCEPQLATEKVADTSWPTVVEEPPKSFQNPKYIWTGAFRGWIDNNIVAQGKEIEQIKDDVKSLNDYKDTQTKQAQNDSKKVDSLQAVVMTSNGMLGQLVQKMTALGKAVTQVGDAVTALSNKTQPTEPAQPTKPSQASQVTNTTQAEGSNK